MINSFYSEDELFQIGFASIGRNVKISRFARFYSPEKMHFADNCRVDDFCILSGSIKVGAYSHISAFTALFGRNGIEIGNFSGLSPRCTVFSAMDDFSGDYLIGPNIPDEYTLVSGGVVKIEEYCQIGASSVLFPSVIVGQGVAVGAMSLVNKSLDPWGIYVGVPARFLKERSKKLLGLDFINSFKQI